MFYLRSLRPLCLSFLFILISNHLTFAQRDFLGYFCVDDNGNYTANSTYKANLNHLLSTLTTDHPNIDYGFYNFSYGQDHDKANAIGLCRVDQTLETCLRCLNDSISLLTYRCPNQKEAIGWYDYCMLRYSSRTLFSFMEDSPRYYMWAVDNASDPVHFTQVAEDFIRNLIVEAASGSSRLKFATGNKLAPNLPMMYGVVQCTPDLSEKECGDCLNSCLGDIRTYSDGKLGGNVMTPSCNFVYGAASYFGSTLPPQPPPQPPTSTSTPTPIPTRPPLVSNRSSVDAEGNGSNKSRTVVVIVVSIIVSLVAVGLVISIYVFLRSRKPGTDKAKDLTDDDITNVESLHFDINTIRNATNMFSNANKLGQGGFGAVYKGRLPNGRDIAVKRLSQFSTQGDAEFKNEVLLVAKLQHRNLVQLLGFCLKENEKLLIYEFVQNSSLEKIIFDPVKRIDLDWERRYKIIDDIVRGLVYLHQDSRLRIIHRDLKTSNILLDGKMNAKISDFGTAKLIVADQTRGDTSRIIGTFGYMAPEYVIHGQFSVKSDVYSFGVIVLEIVSGQRNNRVHNDEDVEDLVSNVWRSWQEGSVVNIVDPSLKSGSKIEMERCILIGLLCVQEDSNKRPTMAEILLMLSSNTITLQKPSKPAFLINNQTKSNMSLQWTDNSRGGKSLIYSSLQEGNSIQMSLNDDSSELYPR